MKELSVEEKAKRYDKAIERARYWEKNPTVWSSDDICQKLFPELCELEDEKTKKEIINYLECQSRDEPSRKDTHNKWISYIEKHALSKDDYDFLRDCARVLKTFGWQSYADRLTALCPALGEEAKAMMSTPIIFDESEDERIRRFLIKCVEQPMGTDFLGDIKKEDVLAWLEKQSIPRERIGLEWVNTIDDACNKRYSEEYAHGEYCHEQSFKWGFQEGVDWLEKQGKQKVSEYDVVKTIKERIIEHFDNHLIVDKCFSIGGLKDDILKNILKIINEVKFAKQDEQKSTNVDLDTLVIKLEETIGTSPHSRETIKEFLQRAIQKYLNCLRIANGEIGRLVEENYRLKEKQGEQKVPSREMVLNVWELGNIWKEITKGVCNTEHGTQLEFIIKHWNEGEHYTERLAKQREQKPNSVLDIEIPFGAKDSELQEASYYIPEGFHAEIEGNRVVIKRDEQKPAYTKEYDFHGIKFIPKFAKGDIIKDKKCGEVSTIEDFSYDTGLYTHTYGQFPITIQDNYEIIAQKPAWSEEDIHELNTLSSMVANNTILPKDETINLMNWLKQLRGRCAQQPKQEWSEEDEIKINKIIRGLTACEHLIFTEDCQHKSQLGSLIKWLKSIRPQSHWKPSDEQMKALWDSIPEDVKEISEREMLLNELYKDLKKLREE